MLPTLLAALASLAPAQATDLEARLASDQPAQIAWAAWEAAESERRDLLPALRAAALRVSRGETEKRTLFVLRSLLDALIRLDARCTGGELLELSRRANLTDACCILAARDAAAAQPFLQRQFDESTDVHTWNLAANLLSTVAPADIAPRLVELARIEAHVIVRDPNAGGRGGHSSGIGCGSIEAPEGFPPTAIYMLARHESDRKSTLLAPGPVPIGYTRTVSPERVFGIGGRSEPLDKADTALGLLHRIAGDTDEKARLRSEVEIVHAWSDAASYERRVRQQLAGLRAVWKGLLERLQHARVLSSEQAATPAPLSVTIDDQRSSREVPLPKVE